jgi:hypothetical protein
VDNRVPKSIRTTGGDTSGEPTMIPEPITDFFFGGVDNIYKKSSN